MRRAKIAARARKYVKPLTRKQREALRAKRKSSPSALKRKAARAHLQPKTGEDRGTIFS